MISRHSHNSLNNHSHTNIGDRSDDPNASKLISANQKSKDKTTRSGSGIPSSSGMQRFGGVNSMINNISSGIAQKKQMLKGIWSRGASTSTNGSGIHLNNKNENIDPSNFANRGQSMDISGAQKMGMASNGGSDIGEMTDADLRRYRYPQISKVLGQQPINGVKPAAGKGDLVDQATGIGPLSQHMQPPMIMNKPSAAAQIQGRSFSVNRAFKDITNKVLNSSGAAVIQNNLPTNSTSSTVLGAASTSMLTKSKHG